MHSYMHCILHLTELGIIANIETAEMGRTCNTHGAIQKNREF